MRSKILVPVLLAGIDRTSGFVAFADQWTTNNAWFSPLERILQTLTGAAGTGRLLRAASAFAVLTLAIRIARPPITDARDLVARATIVVSALLLASPAQFPWYVLWVLPLATIHIVQGWHLAAALMPIYYMAFHFEARAMGPVYDTWIVCLIWLPVWLALWRDHQWGRLAVTPTRTAERSPNP